MTAENKTWFEQNIQRKRRIEERLSRAPHGREDSGDAFIREPRDGSPARADDDLAEELAEAYLESATSGEEAAEARRNRESEEERGGPFIETSPRVEFASGVDESNPEDADVEPFPAANRGVR